MPECLDIQAVGRELGLLFHSLRLVLLIEAGTHLIVDALVCPYRIKERKSTALKLLRACSQGMILM
jgi:hypothetical protein